MSDLTVHKYRSTGSLDMRHMFSRPVFDAESEFEVRMAVSPIVFEIDAGSYRYSHNESPRSPTIEPEGKGGSPLSARGSETCSWGNLSRRIQI